MTTISVQTANEQCNALLVDVRTPAEYEDVHVEGMLLHPLTDLQPAKLAEAAAGRPIHILCRSGRRAQQAAMKLTEAGISNVAAIEGGIDAWIAAGFPVVRGRKTISLERQVRIAAGLLVVTGILLGFLVHPGCYALSAFVGCGLIFAGITDWCGMGMLLARMPWNTR